MRIFASSLKLALCFLLSLVAGASQVFAQEPAGAPKAADVQIAIEKEEIIVQGKKLAIPFELEELNKLLGPADRVTKLYNWISTWDELGVIAYCKPNTTKVISVAACFAKKEYKFSPAKLFIGKCTVDGALVTEKSKLEEINQAKNERSIKLAEKTPGLPWSIQYPSVLVTVGEEKVEGEVKGIDQVAISWREPKPAKKPVEAK